MNGCDANGQIASAEVPISVSNWKIRLGVPENVRSNETSSWIGMPAEVPDSTSRFFQAAGATLGAVVIRVTSATG
jgi:hypothetical protein